jgi:hypothetical protein
MKRKRVSDMQPGDIVFFAGRRLGMITDIEPMTGNAGWMELHMVADDCTREYIFSAKEELDVQEWAPSGAV